MDGSAYWTAVGAIAVAVIGVIGNRWIKAREERQSDRDFTTSITATREARPWALMESRIDDLEEALGRLSNSNDKLRAENDRLREERDEARRSAVEWELAAKRAATLRESMVVEVREDHARILALLRAIRDALRHGK